MPHTGKFAPLTARPYQLLCTVCSVGAGEAGAGSEGGRRLLAAIREAPERPLGLACNAGDVYTYQEPGTREDTPEGDDYNRKRDLDILHRLNLAPGSTLPARTLLMWLLEKIGTVRGICGYEGVTSDAWRGCPQAQSGDYERGHEMGMAALLPPRSQEEMAADKRESLSALLAAPEISVRPHILICAVCQYGAGVRPPFEPDNLPELLDLILNRNPDLPIKLVKGADWLMCAPCPSRVVEMDAGFATGACVCGPIGSGGLYNELKDLNVLRQLGLTFGATMEARELFRLIFERLPTVVGVCALPNGDHAPHSLWWDPCGEIKMPGSYEQGREMLRPRFE